MTPPGWNGWLHHTVERGADRGGLQAPPLGIAAIWGIRPPARRGRSGRTARRSRPGPRQPTGGDYEAWSPGSEAPAFIPPPLSSKAPAMKLFRLAQAQSTAALVPPLRG